MHRLVHLVRRFVGSLRPGGPSTADVEWVRSCLSGSEFAVWSAMSGPDRRHSAMVARAVALDLGSGATAPVLAAALLHDSGKSASGLRTPGRVIATLCGLAVIGSSADAKRWASGRGYRARIGTYLLHPEIGASQLESIGSDPITVVWTREHHLPPARCSLDPTLADALRDADDD